MPFTYAERYVSFIDILGFKNKVAHIADNHELFELLLTLPDIVSTEVAKLNAAFESDVDMQGTAFSDSIVISASGTDGNILGLYGVIQTVVTLCKEMMLKGALVRGGLAIGPTYHRGTILFGQGMVDAYQLECDLASVPRVVVAPKVAAYWNEYFSGPGRVNAMIGQIARDSDSLDFVDIFHFPSGDSADNRTVGFFKAAGPELTRQLTKKGITLDVWSKVAWVAQRYNTADFVVNRRIVEPIAIPAFGS